MDGIVKFSPVDMKGSIWDEGGKTDIVQILISYDHISIDSIQFVYAAVDGKLLRSKTHGEIDSFSSFASVGFVYPSEYLVSVSGWHECNVLVSIAFRTNKRTFGPFGRVDDPEDKVDKFAYHFNPKSSFGGFHGCADEMFLRIGVYFRPAKSLAEFMTNDFSG